ncbi:hypothetical protein JXC34_01355 [Candidatus Woesearchaeota archaeon]|nr:hypothetical protein [Candidatus Woesearchaeota archaeon]
MGKSIFGRYNSLVDELIHVSLSFIISIIGYSVGLSLKFSILCFFSGILLDIDHVFNGVIARMLGLKSYKKSLIYSSDGHTIKIMHGFDVALVISSVLFYFFQNFLFSFFIFLSLCIHELWDFLVYPYTWKELFLLTRALTKFNPGIRKSFKGMFFERKTLNY